MIPIGIGSPSIDIPLSMCGDLDSYDVGSRINGVMTYEVIKKDEYGVIVKIKSVTIDSKKRII